MSIGLASWRRLVPVIVASMILMGCGGTQNNEPHPAASTGEQAQQDGSSDNRLDELTDASEDPSSESAEQDPRRIDERIAQDADEVWHGDSEDGAFFYFYLDGDQTWGGFYWQGDGMKMSNGDISREGDDFILNRDEEPSPWGGKTILHVEKKSEDQMRVTVTMEKEVTDFDRDSLTYMDSHVEEVTLFDGVLHKGGEEAKQFLVDATKSWLELDKS